LKAQLLAEPRWNKLLESWHFVFRCATRTDLWGKTIGDNWIREVDKAAQIGLREWVKNVEIKNGKKTSKGDSELGQAGR
jgi:hypothetical protein